MDSITGMARTMPQTSAALVVGGLAIVGLPPFSLFTSEFAILSGAFTQSRYFVATVFLIVLSVVFGGFAYHFLHLLTGEPSRTPASARLILSEYSVMGIAALCLIIFGIRIPHVFSALLQEAMAVLQ
jgi:hydrogenase-4 component F